MVMVIDRVAKMSLRNSKIVRIVAAQRWKYLKAGRGWAIQTGVFRDGLTNLKIVLKNGQTHRNVTLGF